MISADVDLTGWRTYTHGWAQRHHAALTRAVRSSGFWLRGQMIARLRAGIAPRRAKLTRATARRKGPRALAAFAPMVAAEYRGSAAAGSLEALVGISAQGKRRQRPIAVELARQVAGGFTVQVDEAKQDAIAAALRAKGRKRLAGLIPAQGGHVVPPRPFAELVERDSGPKVDRIFSAIYRGAMDGKRVRAEDALGGAA